MSLLDTSSPDNLLAGDSPAPVTVQRTVKSGQVLARGQVCAIETSTGKVVAYDTSRTDGHNSARFICFEDIDATGADAVGSVYAQGCFNESALVFVTTGELSDTMRDQLLDYGIVTKPSVQN